MIFDSIAETSESFIVTSFEKTHNIASNFESEAALEKSLITDLIAQGYDYDMSIRSHDSLLLNIKKQIEKLNKISFSKNEWDRFVIEYLNTPADNFLDKSKKVHENFIKDFFFDDGRVENIYLFDKENLPRNSVQVINQFEQSGSYNNRYDVTILVNGIPLVQIELKKRGVPIKEAFNQIHRYSKESFNSQNSLFKYLQIFVISNGTDTRYFANTTKRNRGTFDFSINWADSENNPINDIKDFTASFLQKNVLLKVLFEYSVLTSENNLLVMRPYQIAATERILRKIQVQEYSGFWGKLHFGGFIWHTTGSGKTLTSFKAAQLATMLPYVDKVFFVVDRKDLDYQTLKEYQKFNADSVLGSNDTAALRANIGSNTNKIIVTTIQKLNNLLRSRDSEGLSVLSEKVVFIFDECHRSQFGEAQQNIKSKFKKFIQFGFTGTPIFAENAILNDQTTEQVFGPNLHTYSILDAIKDQKVLKFKVDYYNTLPRFKENESPGFIEGLSPEAINNAMLHEDRISKIVQHILKTFREKTLRGTRNGIGFNAMFAVRSIEAARLYYEEFKRVQSDIPASKRIKIATIFSFSPNQDQSGTEVGAISEEPLDSDGLNSTDKEALERAISDYNEMFETAYSVAGDGFQNYQKDLALRIIKKEVDLVIVVGMFLTGFDAPNLNTLYVDKNLKYHGLIQAFSRTNRIQGDLKTCGNIVTFVDLNNATEEALRIFANGHNNPESGIIALEKKPFKEQIKEFSQLIAYLLSLYPEPTKIYIESAKKDFCITFGKYLKIDRFLRNYDEYHQLKEYIKISNEGAAALEAFKATISEPDAIIALFNQILLLTDRQAQDYRSMYHTIYDQVMANKKEGEPYIDFDDVVFEIELLKSVEINFEYIWKFLYDNKRVASLKQDAVDLVKMNKSISAKESLLSSFIDKFDVGSFKSEIGIEEAFRNHAKTHKETALSKLILEESLNEEDTRRFLDTALRNKCVKEEGTDIMGLLQKRLSPISSAYKETRIRLLTKFKAFVDEFKDL